MTNPNHQPMSEYELKNLINKLKDIRGRNTELVSLYIPAGYDMTKISDFVTSEKSEAENIKSKQTRKNVQNALDKISRKVREEQETPENGVAFFAGNVSETEGRPEIKIWEVIPPEPIESRHYRCDKEFIIDPLEEMVIEDQIYGLIVVDKNEAAIGSLKGSRIKTIQTLESNVPGKTRAGGQSAQRFARIRKQMLKTFLNDVAEKTQQAFLDKAREDKLLGILVGGPGFVKEKFVDNYLHKELKENLVTTKSLNYSGEEALEELVNKSEDEIKDSKAVKEKKLISKFFKNLKEENGKSEYGLKPVKKALEMGAVETLLISEDFNKYQAEYSCPNGHDIQKIENEPEIEQEIECKDCGKEMELSQITDIIEILAEKAEERGSDMKIISTEHEEGKRLNNLGGVAAILRYRIR